MAGDRISEIRLTAFKTFRDVQLPVSPLTVLIGRNGSGKSNALDGLEVLARLASGEDVRDALDGTRRDGGPIRGGATGCAPFGLDYFELGVTIERDDGSTVQLDVRVQVEPTVEVFWEQLTSTRGGRTTTLYVVEQGDEGRSDLRASVHNGKRGRDPHHFFRSSALLASQMSTRIAAKSAAERLVLDTAAAATRVLTGIFHLDPVPHLMRQYVPAQDVVLRRNAENLSAAVARLRQSDPELFADLLDVVAALPEHEVTALEVRTGGFGEVMLGLQEQQGDHAVTVPARQMSDGTLRLMAIATALLTGGGGVAVDGSADRAADALTLVIEELENGLHPAQAARLLALIREAAGRGGFQVVATTHSPPLLDALTGDEHAGVIVVDRAGSALSTRVRRLIDLPGYAAAMARGTLGENVASNRLELGGPSAALSGAELNSLLGIG